MKIVIIGGKGLIGGKLVALLRAGGHEVSAASRASGVDVLSGAGLAEAMAGAKVVVDVSNSPSFADDEVLRFFETSTRNLLRAMREAGVAHFVALSVVGADRIPDSGYMRAKVAQEALIRAGSVPYTIVRATQFFEFAGAIGESGASGDTVRLPAARMQPIAADDVAAELSRAALAAPLNGIADLAGPEALAMDELVRRCFAATGDARRVVADASARYFGAAVDDRSLVPIGDSRHGKTTLADWLRKTGA